MNKIIKRIGIVFLIIAAIIIGFGMYLNRGLPNEILPADFTELDLNNGHFAPFDTTPSNIFGIGLAYAGHINETASQFDPDIDPPVFKKAISSLTSDGSKVATPNQTTMLSMVETLESGITEELKKHQDYFPALMDYEVELGFVLLEDINAKDLENDGFIPKIGFFIANDLSARSLAVLGEGQAKRYDYWGISKSFDGFTPISNQIWIPNEHKANAIPFIQLETRVNDEIRQSQNTNNLIYTPIQMLQAIHRKYPDTTLRKGDFVLTGTPGGVIFSTPRWLVRLATIAGLDRFKKLSTVSKEDNVAKFLKAGDQVVVEGKGLGSVTIEITD